jgi:histidinol-phosphate aminotransferase
MSPVDPPVEQKIEQLLGRIRPAVRREHAYIVGAPDTVEVKLNQNESPYDLPPDLKQEIAEAVADIPLNRYPNEQPHELRHTLAEYNGVDPDCIIVGNGSNELTYTFGMALIDPGTPVVLPTPMFSLYEKVVRLADGDLTSVPPRSDLSFDTEALIEAIEAKDPALTVLTSPNNPTGLAMPLSDIERIVRAASGFVVVDEAYVEFNPEGSALRLMHDHPNVMLLRTFSKAYGLAGLRIGYMIAHPDVAHEVMKARLPFMVDRLAEITALKLLARPELLQERVELMRTARHGLAKALRAMDGVDVVPSHANFVLFSTDWSASALQGALAERGILIRDMSGYEALDRHVRVNAGTSSENKAFLAALEDTLYDSQGG